MRKRRRWREPPLPRERADRDWNREPVADGHLSQPARIWPLPPPSPLMVPALPRRIAPRRRGKIRRGLSMSITRMSSATIAPRMGASGPHPRRALLQAARGSVGGRIADPGTMRPCAPLGLLLLRKRVCNSGRKGHAAGAAGGVHRIVSQTGAQGRASRSL